MLGRCVQLKKMKSILKKYLLYIGIKYLLYYSWNFGTSLLDWNYSNFEGLIYGAIILSILPISEIIILLVPTIWIVQLSKSNKIAISFLAVIFIAEFFLTVWMTQNKILEHHYVKLIISVTVFFIIFIKEILGNKKEKTAHNNAYSRNAG